MKEAERLMFMECKSCSTIYQFIKKDIVIEIRNLENGNFRYRYFICPICNHKGELDNKKIKVEIK